MKKKKAREKKTYNKLTLWLGVLVLGTIVGISIQFSRAWVEPSATAPGGNIAAPINTGAGIQTKTGTASNKADICVDPTGNGDKKCLGDLVSFPTCTKAGGVPTTIGTTTICKFPGAACPSGWTQYLNYTETASKNCTGSGDCGSSVSSGSHPFDNIDPATEAKTYNDGSNSTWDCGYSQDIDGRCCCWWPCHGTYWVSQTCSSCSQTPHTCAPTITTVGCTAS